MLYNIMPSRVRVCGGWTNGQFWELLEVELMKGWTNNDLKPTLVLFQITLKNPHLWATLDVNHLKRNTS